MDTTSQGSPASQLPDLINPNQLSLTASEKSLLQMAHSRHGYKQIIIQKEFKGGYSGTRVFLVLPVRSGDESNARVITKLGKKSDLHEEKANYDEIVKGSLPFSATQVWEYEEQGEQAALNYVFAGDGALGETLSLDEYYWQHEAAEIKKMLDDLLDKELGQSWYAQTHPLPHLFRDEYGRHLPKHNELKKVADAIFRTMSSPSKGKRIDIPGLPAIPDPLEIYPGLLNKMLKGRKSRVHGDLHPRNILVDQSGKGWLIDFAKVTERHNLFDFIRLETYLRLMVLAPLQAGFSWSEYVQFELALNADTFGRDSRKPVNPELLKAFTVIQTIRRIARKYMGPEPDFKNEYFPALFLYCLAMLKYYKSHGAVPTQLVFITACALLVDISEERAAIPPALPRRQSPSEETRSGQKKNEAGTGGGRNVSFGKEAIGNLVATGDNNNIRQSSHIVHNSGVATDQVATTFAPVWKKISEMEAGPAKIIAQTAVEGLEKEVKKGEQADEKTINSWFNSLAQIAPDIWEVIIDTFVDPIQGISTVFKKIARRAREEKNNQRR